MSVPDAAPVLPAPVPVPSAPPGAGVGAAGARFSRVAVTGAAADVLRRLRAEHGELLFHQSGGCCDGSAPMCYPRGELILADADVHLGDLPIGTGAGDAGGAGAAAFTVPVWVSRAQFEYWRFSHLTIDVVAGRGAGFSLEAVEGVRFLSRSRLLTDDELAALGNPERTENIM